jgi:hypothetical protein
MGISSHTLAFPHKSVAKKLMAGQSALNAQAVFFLLNTSLCFAVVHLGRSTNPLCPAQKVAAFAT